MASEQRRSSGPRRGRDQWETWRGEDGRCGVCQTKRRPVAQYANFLAKPRWLCDRCFIEQMLVGWHYLPWEQRDVLRDHPDAAWNFPPKEPALRRRPVAGEDRAEAAPAPTSPAGWEEEDNEDDRRLRLSELRRVGFAMLALFQDSAAPDDERRGLLRAMKVLKERTLEIGG